MPKERQPSTNPTKIAPPAPKVSVIVPVFNSDLYLQQCLTSLCSQTFKDIEIIPVDDGSTDDSYKIIQEFSARDPRITPLRMSTNTGTFRSRLEGLMAARGDYIGTVDADDWVHPEFIEKLYWKALSTGAEIVECRLWMVDTNLKYQKCAWADHRISYSEGEQLFRKILSRKIWHIAANKLFSRALFSQASEFLGNIDEHIIIADDKLLTIPMFYLANSYSQLKERLYFYRQTLTSASNNRSVKHDLKHIRDTAIVDRNINLFLSSKNISIEIGALLKKNQDDEILLILNNLTHYPIESPDRNLLYEELQTHYGPKALATLHGEYCKNILLNKNTIRQLQFSELLVISYKIPTTTVRSMTKLISHLFKILYKLHRQN